MKNSNNFFIALIVALFVGSLLVPTLSSQQIEDTLRNPVFWASVAVIMLVVLSSLALIETLETFKRHMLREQGKLDAYLEAEAKKQGFFARMWQKMQDSRPIEEEAEIELDHSYDGIRELDNNLPPWWLWGFYLSIVFAVVYLMRFHVLKTAPLPLEEFAIQIAEGEAQRAAYLKNASDLVDETNVVLLSDAGAISAGQKIFATNCASCHAADGGGGIGPNVTDDYWLHGGDVKDVFGVIKYGVDGKGMISWQEILKPNEMQQVASYILSLHGTTPAAPKEPQGTLYTGAAGAETPAEAPADTSAVPETPTEIVE